jgi:hypothetical protein
MASPVSAFTVSMRCSGNAPNGLIAKTKYNGLLLTAANIVAQKADALALANAEAGLSTGVLASSDITTNISQLAGYPTAVANRGEKWIITASDANGRKYTYTIPAADETGNLQADNYTALLTSTAWAAYVTAFNAYCQNPQGNAITLQTARLGGRRR